MPRDPKTNYLAQHRPFFGDEDPIQVTAVEKSQVVRFMYNGKERFVMVVHPNWNGLLHGLDLKTLPRRELLMVINAPEDLTEHQLYRQYVAKREIKERDSYRTYDRLKVTGLRSVFYDSTLQPGEKDEQFVEAPKEPEI